MATQYNKTDQTATMVRIRTAPDERSLIALICGCKPGDTKSHNFSMAVLNASAAQIKPDLGQDDSPFYRAQVQ